MGINKVSSFSLDIDKQHSSGVPSGAILFVQRIFIEKLELNLKIAPDAPTCINGSGLIQMIMMGKSIHQIWVKKHTDLQYLLGPQYICCKNVAASSLLTISPRSISLIWIFYVCFDFH